METGNTKARAGHTEFQVLLETHGSVWEEGRDTGLETTDICQGRGREHPIRECGVGSKRLRKEKQLQLGDKQGTEP